MDSVYDFLRILHVFGFVFMSVPLFNLIVVNERALLGSSFNYYADRYLENIIRHGATRCFAFQATVLVTGVLMLVVGPFGIEELWTRTCRPRKTSQLGSSHIGFGASVWPRSACSWSS